MVARNIANVAERVRASLPVFFILLSINITIAKEVEVAPERIDTVGGSLGDIDCRLKSFNNYDWKNYRDDDKVTWAHEGTHGLNARIKIENKMAYGFYLLNGKAIVLSNPNFTLKDLAKKIPKENRGKLYKLYIVDAQKWWNEKPLYCVDELSAYVNGCIVGIETGMLNRAKYSLDNAKEMYIYSEIAYNMCSDNYVDKANFRNLLDILKKRIELSEKNLKK